MRWSKDILAVRGPPGGSARYPLAKFCRISGVSRTDRADMFSADDSSDSHDIQTHC
jgi:hypothetical protein